MGGDGHSVALVDGGEATELVSVPDGAECPEVAAACFSADGVNLAGDTVFYSVCCEPASGQYFRQVVGSDPTEDQSRLGQVVDVDADGYQLVVDLSIPLVEEVNPAGVAERSFDTGDPTWHAYDAAWSVDRCGRGVGGVSARTATRSSTVFEADRGGSGTTIAEADQFDSFKGLVIDAQGRLWYAVQDRGVVADPLTGETLGEFDYTGNVVDQNIDQSGQFLIISLEDGSVQWRSIDGAQSGVLAQPGSGYIAADW